MGIIKDPKSWRAGFELGLAGFSFPYSKPRKPTAYLYNGIRLPALPEWDKTVYPFAYLFIRSTDNAYCFMADKIAKQAATPSGTIQYGSGERFVLTDGEWVPYNTIQGGKVFWTNEDFYYSDSVSSVGGTLCLEASDPVPVYE